MANARPIAGTLPYMSPEQVRGEKADARSDIFAFGAVLYEMTAGKRAFAADSRAGLVAMILERDPPSLSDLRPACPRPWTVLSCCLAKDPAERWQHAYDVVLGLKGIRELNGDQQPVRPNRPSRVTTIAGLGACRSRDFRAWIYRSWLARLADSPRCRPSAIDVRCRTCPMGNAWSPALSSDGRTIAFIGAQDAADIQNFYIRYLDTAETRQ